MPSYPLRYWYLHRRDEKDFDDETIVAENPQSAKEKLYGMFRCILSVYLIAVDGVECEKVKL